MEVAEPLESSSARRHKVSLGYWATHDCYVAVEEAPSLANA
jgi:hypothetical protein